MNKCNPYNSDIANIWQVIIHEEEVFKRVTDESLMNSYQRVPENPKGDGNVITDDDRSYFERYYRYALAELSVLLAKRTTRVGGKIESFKNDDTGFLTTVYTMPMTYNHESELLNSLASFCLAFIIARVQEKWYGHGADFGSEDIKKQIREVLNFRRVPVERHFRPL